MTRLIKLTTISAVLLTGALLATEAEAGHCYRSRSYAPYYRTTYYRAPLRRPAPPLGLSGPGPSAPGLGGPGALPPGGIAGQPAAGPVGVGAGAQGIGGQGIQGVGGQATQMVNVPVGATITLPGARGTEMGTANLVLSGVRLPLMIKDWNETGVTMTLPDMQINQATQAQLEIVVPGANTPELLTIQLQPRPAVLIVQ